MKKYKVILICNYSENSEDTILKNIQSFKEYSRHDVFIFNTKGIYADLPPLLDFDILVVHYTICIARGGWLTLKAKKQIREFRGYKAIFIQDDYRWINATVANVAYMKFNALFGLASQEIVPYLYPKEVLPELIVETVLAGYVSDEMIKNESKLAYEKRPIDVSYRARKLPYWLGQHAMQKYEIAEKFLQSTKDKNLKCDISTKHEDRLFGKDWQDLLMKSKTVLLTESGVSLCDFTGEIQSKVEGFVEKNPEVSFETVSELFFEGQDGKYMMNVLSPRVFEAISERTLQICYPGDYQGILKVDKHCVLLKRDHSNISEVLSVVKSPEKAKQIIERAYNDIVCNPKYHYRAYIKQFEDVIDKETSTVFFLKLQYLKYLEIFVYGPFQQVRLYLFEAREQLKKTIIEFFQNLKTKTNTFFYLVKRALYYGLRIVKRAVYYGFRIAKNTAYYGLRTVKRIIYYGLRIGKRTLYNLLSQLHLTPDKKTRIKFCNNTTKKLFNKKTNKNIDNSLDFIFFNGFDVLILSFSFDQQKIHLLVHSDADRHLVSSESKKVLSVFLKKCKALDYSLNFEVSLNYNLYCREILKEENLATPLPTTIQSNLGTIMNLLTIKK